MGHGLRRTEKFVCRGTIVAVGRYVIVRSISKEKSIGELKDKTDASSTYKRVREAFIFVRLAHTIALIIGTTS